MHPEHVLEILLPFHGRIDHFQEAVRSVLSQTSSSWRLIVVDDAAEGDVGSWLAELGDARIEHHRNDVNLGFAANFQRCLDLASAEHVVFLGGDDRLKPDYVRRVGAIARNSGATMVQPGVAVLDSEGRLHDPLGDRVKRALRGRLPRGELVSGEAVATSIMHGAWTYFPSICWRRAPLAALGFDSSYGLVLDVATILSLLRGGGTLLLLDEVLFEYRRHDASASMRGVLAAGRFGEERAAFNRMAGELRAQGWTRASRAARWHVTSRLHAATLLPRAFRVGPSAAGNLLRHVVHR